MEVNTGAPKEYGSMTTVWWCFWSKDVRMRLQTLAYELTDCGFFKKEQWFSEPEDWKSVVEVAPPYG